MREPQPPKIHVLAAGDGWSASEFVCEAGPQDPAFEEQHAGVSVAFVLSGTFRYRTEAGDALLYPGAFLLGAAGRCFECSHEHGRGDRCVSFNYDEAYFAEIAHAATGKLNFSFSVAALPPSAALLALGLRMAGAGDTNALAMDELAAQIPLAVTRAIVGRKPAAGSAVARDRARVADLLRLLEDAPGDPWSLDRLARRANVSKFHLLRVFTLVTGMTPYKYLLGLRLRRAAMAITEGGKAISTIAFDEGFGDLSTFNAHFKAAFGAAPSRWRARR